MKVEAISGDLLKSLQSEALSGTQQNIQVNQANFTDQLASIDERILAVSKGEKIELHELMIDIERAKLSLEYSVALRDKLIDAYKEVTRMQV
ncbi:flagellar hook-basal body complex protein FliE [Photobacterium sp. CCB-ST2H9]|uniref:flagellar hook-basal body complex protein FliE n=1 Tax=Photobacterium sp. CCB-ST2H9 TaxID=2912855 RepID=UPI00200405BF|nr:flagellar hook-basal body complex protein FliE [Photobacterium sp. CCB-ST2H9]UTM58470.1 flagellar hook-basal body complex protein FliE [Photobacterium sp. CCB-ST2H9]